MKTLLRDKSLITGCDVEPLYTIKDFPIHMLRNEGEESEFCDMDFTIGKEDGFVQLGKIIPPEVLYKDTHSNAIGKVWENAHRLVANWIKKYSNNKTYVLEVGGGLEK